MRAFELARIYKRNFKNRDNFKGYADWIVENCTQGLDDEAKRHLSADTAVGMAMGEALTKNKYLLIGSALGAVGTGLAVKLYNDFKDRVETEEKED